MCIHRIDRYDALAFVVDCFVFYQVLDLSSTGQAHLVFVLYLLLYYYKKLWYKIFFVSSFSASISTRKVLPIKRKYF